MKRKMQGSYRSVTTAGETVRAFIPAPLPPVPPIEWSEELRAKFDRALMALGRLDSASALVPDIGLFLYMYVRKEAVLSSMIEGTQSSLSDLLLFEMAEVPGVPLDDAQEVSSYVAALDHGLMRLRNGFPLSLRLLTEMHGVLLAKGRGSDRLPGEFRSSQNWIGGTRPGNAVFVPPPADEVVPCLGALELFLHDRPTATPALVKAALAHVQFETIHPFLDGNGRLGRLLITLVLCEEKILREPLLYLSLYFKSNRRRYYELLNAVRTDGNWEKWLDFFADAVIDTAEQAVAAAGRMAQLVAADRAKVAVLGRTAPTVAAVHRALLERPVATAKALAARSGLSMATVNKGLVQLTALGIVRETTEKRRNRIYTYAEYIAIMNEGTELPS